jgi:hypothetical protein
VLGLLAVRQWNLKQIKNGIAAVCDVHRTVGTVRYRPAFAPNGLENNKPTTIKECNEENLISV